jgi:hypothetical protein
LTTKGQPFVIKVKSGNKIVIMATPKAFEILSKAEQWHVDGTFHVAAKYYHQLWIIHAWIDGLMVPCAYALMHRRRARDYEIVLRSKQITVN